MYPVPSNDNKFIRSLPMRKMPLTDAFFLLNESSRTPMHVGGVNLFTLPEGVDDVDFLQTLSEALVCEGELRRPFGEKLKMGPLGALGTIQWVKDEALDMDYHIRRSALPKPGRYRELFALVSRLHGTLMDRTRPLWELHLIEGLQNRQFATYMKAHHCAIDGVGSMQLTTSMMSPDPKSKIKYSPFSMEAYEAFKKELDDKKESKVEPKEHEIKAVLDVIKSQLGGTVNVANALRQNASVWLGRGGNLSVPWHNIPKTPYNTHITGARRFVAQSWPFERVRAVGKAFNGGTLNDAVLAMCAGSLRRHLLELGQLPKQSLKAMAPISLRDSDDTESANAIAFLTADLGTNQRDPSKRMRVIQESMQAAKDQFKGMNRREIEVYSAVTQAPALIASMTGLASRFPAFSTVISNVPGPRETMYWNGARLDGIYPVSVPFDGFAVNITLVSNGDNLDFGIVACRHSVPQVQRLIDYMEDSLIELEEAAGIVRKSKRAPLRGVKIPQASTDEGGTKAKTKTKSRAKAKATAKPASKAKAKTKAKAKAKTVPKTSTTGADSSD
jgi:diacylglycerol O-acyltransferase